LLYQGIPDAQEYLKFVSGSGTSGYGVQVGPYVGQFIPFAGVSEDPLHPAFNIYCVDYTHYAKSQLVNVSALEEGSLAATRLGNDDFARYRKAAYLSSLFHDLDHAGNWAQIHAAIWSITSGVTIGSTGGYVTMANSNAATFDTNGWYVLTPTNKSYSSSGQEFLMRRVSVPEPATFLLMATGLLFLAAISRKRLGDITRQDA
jgi:hypothetical protein